VSSEEVKRRKDFKPEETNFVELILPAHQRDDLLQRYHSRGKQGLDDDYGGWGWVGGKGWGGGGWGGQGAYRAPLKRKIIET
jgi:hypothetical protein